MGRYKLWNGLLEWYTRLDYWSELFSFYGQVSEFIFVSLLSYDLQVSGYIGVSRRKCLEGQRGGHLQQYVQMQIHHLGKHLTTIDS